MGRACRYAIEWLGLALGVAGAASVVQASSDAAVPERPPLLVDQWFNGTLAAGAAVVEAGEAMGVRSFAIPAGVRALNVTLRWTSAADLSDLDLFVMAPGIDPLHVEESFGGASRPGRWANEAGSAGAPDSPASILLDAQTMAPYSCDATCDWHFEARPHGPAGDASFSVHVEGRGSAPRPGLLAMGRPRFSPPGSGAPADIGFAPSKPSVSPGSYVGAEVALAIGVAGTLGPALSARRLIRGIAVAVSTRVTKADALHHPARARLLAVVQRNPGLFEKEFHALVRSAWGTVVFHLSVLERAGLVETQKVGRLRCYFAAAAFRRDEMRAVALLRSAASARVAAALREAPCPQQELRHRLRLADSTVSWHLTRLTRQGLATTDALPAGGHVVSLTKLGRESLGLADAASRASAGAPDPAGEAPGGGRRDRVPA